MNDLLRLDVAENATAEVGGASFESIVVFFFFFCFLSFLVWLGVFCGGFLFSKVSSGSDRYFSVFPVAVILCHFLFLVPLKSCTVADRRQAKQSNVFVLLVVYTIGFGTV